MTTHWHYREKEFHDSAENIEGVNIHYVLTPLSGAADWDNERATRFMPLVQSRTFPRRDTPSTGVEFSDPPPLRLRKKILKLPRYIPDLQSGALTDRYLLHYYFEVFQDGHRRYSSLYTEEISTSTGVQCGPNHAVIEEKKSSPFPPANANMKESKE